MFKRSFIFLLLLAGCLTSIQAQEKVSLHEAVQHAIQNSTDIRSAQLTSAETRNLAYQAITEGLPTVNAKVEYTNNFQIGQNVIEFTDVATGETQTFLAGFGTPHQADLLFDASQLLVDGRYFVGLKARRSIVESSELQYEMDVIDIKENVMNAYYGTLAAAESEKLIEENLASVRNVLRETSILYENGFAEEIDVDRLQLSEANLVSQLTTAKRQKANAMNSLKFLMGMDIDENVELTESLTFLVSSIKMREFEEPDPMFRVEYRLLQNQKQLREYDIAQKRAGYFPTLYGFANFGTTAFRNNFDFISDREGRWYANGAAGLTLNVPIFDGLKRNSSVQESKIKVEMSKNQINRFEESLELEVDRAYTDFSAAYENYVNLQKNVELAQKIFRKSQIMYKEGVGSSQDLSSAESDLTSTQINFIDASYNLLVSKNALDKSLGKL